MFNMLLMYTLPSLCLYSDCRICTFSVLIRAIVTQKIKEGQENSMN